MTVSSACESLVKRMIAAIRFHAASAPASIICREDLDWCWQWPDAAAGEGMVVSVSDIDWDRVASLADSRAEPTLLPNGTWLTGFKRAEGRADDWATMLWLPPTAWTTLGGWCDGNLSERPVMARNEAQGRGWRYLVKFGTVADKEHCMREFAEVFMPLSDYFGAFSPDGEQEAARVIARARELCAESNRCGT